ncbi:A disintegrin and metalloproteinase with thrombospondin motifs 7-like isoform X2 [Gigantopelta aegis]|uniref:A disintegrin and metalloproteinase with thrombospondin motifs 7-like isoform X2 n=1 Tax=Gigantopelta aegis TaxID=1735272 RepID=UPI001B88BC24|nr:A disintegrin and metalloproteinase with thrombospondin motifs 7-like isoform X2 [Gigantopelta aegis]
MSWKAFCVCVLLFFEKTRSAVFPTEYFPPRQSRVDAHSTSDRPWISPAYQEWYKRATGYSVSERRQSAFSSIWKHYASVLHGINTIYQSLESHRIFIGIKLVDIQVVGPEAIWKSSYSYTRRGKAKNVIASEVALDNFYRWCQKQTSLPSFDHALLITGYDLMQNGDTTKSGRAYLGTICTAESVSIVENDFSSEIIQISAHELGHSLGAKHDGEFNRCHDVDGFLMASVQEINSTNRWSFSSCSVEYIQTKLYYLKRKGNNCLQRTDHTISSSPIGGGGGGYMSLGQLYTPDEHCQLIEGKDSYFCRDFYSNAADYSHICFNMWCHVADYKRNICNNYEGSDGYICGNKKICRKGACVFDKDVPAVLDFCPQGDQPGIIWNNYTCAELVRHEPEMCYDRNTRVRCCQSCYSINTQVQGCEYGDRSSWCRTDLVIPTGCYSNEQLCCETCSKLKDLANPTCPFGDKSTWCMASLKPPYECYDNEDLCCGTCQKYRNSSNIGCEYGDKSTWCRNDLQPPHNCYKNSDLCCESCAKFYNPSFPGCEYGDRSKWCTTTMEKPYGCYVNQEFCCGTCAKWFNASQVGCEYGDKHVDCSVIQYPIGCYDNENLCCRTCAMMKNADIPGCEFGDRSTWCETDLNPQYDCHLNKKLCCDTCKLGDLYGGQSGYLPFY